MVVTLARAAAAVAVSATMSAALLLAAPPAGATSCATDPRATPRAIAAHTYWDFGDQDFFDRFDVALLGTVTGKSIAIRAPAARA
jgi:hypothetical protein